MVTIHTIGHSNRACSEFLQKLQENGIDRLVDIRTFPRSRFNPHFNQNSLSGALSEKNIQYLFRGKNLGGRGVNVGYEEAIDELVEMARSGKKVCVMCSEGDYRECHRYEMLTPSFEERGVKVEHIEYEKKA